MNDQHARAFVRGNGPWPAVLAAGVIGLLTAGQPARAADESIQELKAMIEKLQQRVQQLEDRGAPPPAPILPATNAPEVGPAPGNAASQPATVTAGADGFSIRSADTNFLLRIKGYVQTDVRYFADDNPVRSSKDTFLLRRARPTFEGTLYGVFDYRMVLDVGSGITSTAPENDFLQDAWVSARWSPALQLQVGKYKVATGLDRAQSDANLLFLERSYPSQLEPNREVGAELHGELFEGVLKYSVGIVNGVADGGSEDTEVSDNGKDVYARLFAELFKTSSLTYLQGFGLGVAGTTGDQGGALRSYATSAKQTFFTYRTGTGVAPNVIANGPHDRLAPQAYYYWGPFGIIGEYAFSSQKVQQSGGGAGAGAVAKLDNTGWQASASYILTGEKNTFSPLVPKNPVTLGGGGGWGAFEIAGRVMGLNVDQKAFPIFANPDVSVSKAFTWDVGLNWHLNRNLKLSLDYEQTRFTGSSNNPLVKYGEQVVLSRAQFSF